MAGQMRLSVLVARWCLLGCVGFLLTACQGSDLGQLFSSMTQERTLADLEEMKRQQEVAPGKKPDPLPKIPDVEPFQYSAGSLSDPFSRDNVARPWEAQTQVVLVDDKEEELGPDPLAPDLTRERQPLEEFPLDSVTFVGSWWRWARPEVSYCCRAPGRRMKLRWGTMLDKIMVKSLTLIWIRAPW